MVLNDQTDKELEGQLLNIGNDASSRRHATNASSWEATFYDERAKAVRALLLILLSQTNSARVCETLVKELGHILSKNTKVRSLSLDSSPTTSAIFMDNTLKPGGQKLSKILHSLDVSIIALSLH